MLVVKKYPNRRLYDTAQSRYITLEDLADRIKAGADVLVQDVQSGADLTQATLTQIILESRGGARLLPVPLLVRLIRLGDEALAEFLGRYVSWALELYVQARQGARAIMPLNPLATAPFAATDALARLVLGASQWANPNGAGHTPAGGVPTAQAVPMPMPEVPKGVSPGPPPMDVDAEFPPPPPPPPMHDVADDVARLRREIDELRRSMSKPAAARAPKRAAKSKKR
jgi:polyhydroxyalkanoate synthesis repressor PhaR